MKMLMLLVIVFIKYIQNSPEDIEKLSQLVHSKVIYLKQHGSWPHGYDSCFRMASFIAERITEAGDFSSVEMQIDKLSHQNFNTDTTDVLDLFKQDLTKNIQNKQIPLYYIIGFSNLKTKNDHYAIVEYYKNEIYLYQSYQGLYTFDRSLKDQKSFYSGVFNLYLKYLLTSDNPLILNHCIKELFCYSGEKGKKRDERECQTIKDQMTNKGLNSIRFSFINLAIFNFKKTINFSELEEGEALNLFGGK